MALLSAMTVWLHQPAAEISEVPTGWKRLVVGEEKSTSVGEADVKHLRFGPVYVKTDCGSFLPKLRESAWGRVWSYVVGVGEGWERDSLVSRATAVGEQ